MLTMWHPYNEWGLGNLRRTLSTMEALRREMSSMLSEDSRWGESDESPWDSAPHSTLEDKGEALVLLAEVPGLTEKDIEVTVTGDTISLRGERSTNVPEGYNVYRRERGAFKFCQSYVLPVKVDSEKAQATVTGGILQLVLPKAAEAQPRKITVKSN